MRILQVYHIFPASFGGVSTVVYQVTKDLYNKGHTIHVLTTNAYFSGKKCLEDEVKIHRFGLVSEILSRNNLIVPEMKFLSCAKRIIEGCDCIHIHGYRNPYYAIIHYYAKKYGVPYVLQAHGSLPRVMVNRRLKWVFDVLVGYRLLRDAAKVIALNRVEAEQYRGIGVPEDKIEIIPNGIDLSEYADLPHKGRFKKKFGIDDDEKIVLYLGRIHRIKGIDILVKAFAKVIKKLDKVKLVVVGFDDGYLDELETLTKDLKIEENILITGPLYGKDKLEAYVDADVYVLPSRYETFPMTVLEAVASETPVILTENCGIAEYVRDKVGLVVKSNPKHLCKALLEMLLDQDRPSKFRKKCRTAIERFDISKTVLKLEELYEESLR